MTGILGLGGLILAIIENERFSSDGIRAALAKSSLDTDCTVLRWLVTSTTIPLVFVVIFRSWCSFHYNKSMLPLGSSTVESERWFVGSIELKWGLFEGVLNGIHCPPYITGSIKLISSDTPTQTADNDQVLMPINSLLTVFMLLRVYLIFRLFVYLTKWQEEWGREKERKGEYNERVEDIMRKYSISPEILELKAFYRKNPFLSLVALMILAAALFGYAIRAFERPLYPDLPQQVSKGDTYQDYYYFWNGIWLVFIAMATVGYGDLYPKTYVGRGLCIGGIIVGITLFSMLTISMISGLSFSESEEVMHSMVTRSEYRTQYKRRAANCIIQLCRLSKHTRTSLPHPTVPKPSELPELQRREELRCGIEELIESQRLERESCKRDADSINKRIWLLKERDSQRESYRQALSLLSQTNRNTYTH